VSDYRFFRDLRTEVTIPDQGILSRTLYSDDRLSVTIFGFDTGQELSEHTSTKAAVVEVIEGRARVVLGQDEHEAGPGSWIHMPAGLRHAIEARTPVIMLLTLLRDGAG
jgi:quercetin dioxygenase-like cupin family protein